MLIRLLGKAVLVLGLLFGAIYGGDYLSVAFPRNGGAFGSIQVKPYYAVRKKNKQIEYMFLEPQMRTCVHSLFPHFGDEPCWYVERNRIERIEM